MRRPEGSREIRPGRIGDAFRRGGAEGRPLLVPFVTAGYPALEDTVPVVEAMAGAGADIVELGIPFSEPLADGPTIQRASEVALDNGVTVARVLAMVEEIRRRPSTAELALVLMGYCNPLFAFGLERFLERAADVGVDGLIVPDLPPEEAGPYRAGCVDHGLSATFLVAPNAPDDRIRRVDGCSTHFTYCVTVTGVTGARERLEERTLDFLGRVRSLTDKPFVVGFGVAEPEHVRTLGPHADGVVVGSALLDRLAASDDPAAAAEELIGALRRATREVVTAGERDSECREEES